MEEYEKRLVLIQYMQTLVDAINKLSPFERIPPTPKGETEDPTVREHRQLLTQEWMMMYRDFLKKISKIGSTYPIEEILGIAKPTATQS